MREEEMSDETQEKEAPPEKPLDKMTAKELRELAAGMAEITSAHGMKKDELLAAIKKAKGIEETTPVKKKKAAAPASGLQTVKEMKAKIVQLRKAQEEMRRAGDRKQTKILRRRINRLKKRSRRPAQV
jgi:hypothetical protein